MISKRSTCRGCQSPLYAVLSLGKIVPSTFLKPEERDPAPLPLELAQCAACGLVQLQHTVDPETLYRQYWYVSGTNDTMKQELRSVVEDGVAMLGRVPDRVVDVGANDGTLLSYYTPATTRIAFEPAYNLIERLAPHTDLVINDFFPGAHGLVAGSVDLCTSIAMFYDLDDPRAFVAEIDRVLSPDGLWIVQFQDLAQMLQTHAFDNIGHEHLCYYSLESFSRLLWDHDLAIAKAERRAINGGSLRLYVRRLKEIPFPAQVTSAMEQERGWTDLAALERFAWHVGEMRKQIHAALDAASLRGPIDLYAASTKSSTLLQYCGVDSTVIRQGVERTPEKVGLVTSGTRIPIVNEHTWRMDPAPTTIIGAYQFAEAFMAREREYGSQGGVWLIPLPTVRLVTQTKAVA